MGWVDKIFNHLPAPPEIIYFSPGPTFKVITPHWPGLLALLLIFCVLLGGLAGVFNGYSHYCSCLTARLADLEEANHQNTYLHLKLITLEQETERLRKDLDWLKLKNREVQGLLEDRFRVIEGAEEEEADTEEEGEGRGNGMENRVKDTSFHPVLQLHYFEQKAVLPYFLRRQRPGVYLNSVNTIARTENNLQSVWDGLPQRAAEVVQLGRLAERYRQMLPFFPDIWPVSGGYDYFISSLFGWRKDPLTGQRRFHTGLDIGVWYNTPVLAAAGGRVQFAGWADGYGRLIIIKHHYGLETRYGHLGEFMIKTGDRVEKGQVIALSGNSGRSTGPHLHFEVRRAETARNPLVFLQVFNN